MSEFLRHKIKGSQEEIGFTLAASYDGDTMHLHFGVAKCCKGKEDTFSKKRGKELAERRLEVRPTFSVFIKPEDNLREVFNNTFNEVSTLLNDRGIKRLKRLKNPGTLKTNKTKPSKVVEPSFEIN